MGRTRIFVGLVFSLAAGPLVAQDGGSAPPGVDKVVDCMRGNIPESVRIQTIEITARDRAGGERSLRGQLFGKQDDKYVRVMMRIEAPADLAGASYLVRASDDRDEMYMFLPAINKVRRITGASIDGSLWGTDLSYADVKQMQSAFDGARAELEQPAKIQDRPMHVVSFIPRKEDQSRYTRLRTFVDMKTCVAMRIDFIEGEKPRKQMTARVEDLKQSGKHWYLAEALIRDLKDATQTRLRVLGVKPGDKLSDRYFNPKTFHIGG